VIRLLIVIAAGVVLGVVGAIVVGQTLAAVANGTPSNASLYQYGTR
jgi:hypothetical protein